MTFRRILMAAASGLALAALPASPGAADDAKTCSVLTDDKDAAIAACSRAIAAGKLKGQELAELYITRGAIFRGYKNDPDRAIADLTQAVRIAPKYAKPYVDRGFVYSNAKRDYDRAIADFTAAIRIDPKNKGAHHYRGSAYEAKKDYNRAIADFSAEILLDPQDSSGWFYRGSVYFWWKDDYDRAIADFSEAIKIRPDSATFNSLRGRSYEKKGEIERAVADYRAALRYDPNYDSAREGLERLEPRAAAAAPAAAPAPTAPVPAGGCDMSEKPEALDACSRLIASGSLQGPALAETYGMRGTMYLLFRNDVELASADVNEAIRIDPTTAQAYFFRGMISVSKGDPDRAMADLAEVIRLKPSDDEARLFRTLVQLYDRRDYDGAIAEASELIGLQPQRALPYALRARSQEVKGEAKKAAADYRRALDIDKSDVEIMQRFEQQLAATGNVFWAFVNVFAGIPLPASPAASPPPAPPAAAPSAQVAAAARPGTVRELLETRDLIGYFAADCSMPASEHNPYIVHRPNGDYVQRDSMTSATMRSDTHVIDSATETGSGEIAVSMANERGRLDAVVRIEARRWRLAEATYASGERLIADGRLVQSGAEMAWLGKCQ